MDACELFLTGLILVITVCVLFYEISTRKQICVTDSAKDHNDPKVQEYSDHEFVKETESVQIGSLLDSHYSIDSDPASGSICNMHARWPLWQIVKSNYFFHMYM